MSREMCYRCFWPRPLCWCGSIRPMATRTRFLVLMHPKEFKHEKAATGRLTTPITFTDDAAVRLASASYLQAAAPMYAFIGLAIAMYFAAQGAARVLGPVLAQTGRLVFVGAGGWLLMAHHGSVGQFYALAAVSMVLLGVLVGGLVIALYLPLFQLGQVL
mgnify:CR=1 FL=1